MRRRSTDLQYADPKEGLSIVDAPVPNSDGSVELAYQLEVPPGHGITPELVVQYGSGGDNGWMGVGWDLSVGEVTIDTTFGAPRFDEDVESESYLLDGALLVPNANDDAGAGEPRVDGDRNDFSRQVDTEYEEIIRHQVGTDWPADYFWEVRAKDGSVRWYGGTPDSGGPVPATPGTIDESAVVRNEAGHIVKWLLSAKRDIGVNLIRYEYETSRVRVRRHELGRGRLRSGQRALRPAHLPRPDPLHRRDVGDRRSQRPAIRDRLPPRVRSAARQQRRPRPRRSHRRCRSRVRGRGRRPAAARRGQARRGAGVRHDRTYDTIAARYEFDYAPGRFGKSLLTEMIQGVDDLHVHEVEYYDDLTGTDDGGRVRDRRRPGHRPRKRCRGGRQRHHVPRHHRRRLGARRRRDERRLRQPLHRVQPDLAVEDVLLRRRPRAQRRRHRGDRGVDRPQRRQPARQGVPRRQHREVPPEHHRSCPGPGTSGELAARRPGRAASHELSRELQLQLPGLGRGVPARSPSDSGRASASRGRTPTSPTSTATVSSTS